MIDGITYGIDATGIGAGITAFLVDTRTISCTILVDDTLGIRACGRTIEYAANTIRATRRGIAWVYRFQLFGCFVALHEWITHHL